MDPFGAVPAGDGAVKQCWGGPERKELSAAGFTVCIRLHIRNERHCRLLGKSKWTWAFLGLQGVRGGRGGICATNHSFPVFPSKILCNCLGKVGLATAGQEQN